MVMKIINKFKNKLLWRKRVRRLILNLSIYYLRKNNKLPEKTKLVYEYFLAHNDSEHIISELDAAIIYNLVLKYNFFLHIFRVRKIKLSQRHVF